MADHLLIVTGMSGAGRSSCLKVLEDLDFEAVDNLPLPLLERMLRLEEGLERDLAVGMDTRTRAFDPARLTALLDSVKASPRLDAGLVFFDCDDDVLQRRFTETRRRHPMAADRPVGDGIAHERKLLAPLKTTADLVIDTSQMTLPELRRLLTGHFGGRDTGRLALSVVSFSFRKGVPREADLVFDVRFLRNPHYIETLAALTGRDPEVQRFVEADPGFADFFERLSGLMRFLLPRFAAEGKSYLTVAIGCTGGQHRSVFLAERLAETLRDDGFEIATAHRELAGVEKRVGAAS